MKWRSFISKLKEIYETVNETDQSTVYMENNLIRMVKKNKDKINLYFHADINPAFSAETAIVIGSMQDDYNFELDELEVFYFSEDSLYRGRKALEQSETDKREEGRIDIEYQNLLENLSEEEMFHC